jgi:vancomycin resistance protein VanW
MRYETYFRSRLPPFIFNTLYWLRVRQLTWLRWLKNIIEIRSFAKDRGDPKNFPYSCKKHQSLIRRKLGNSDPALQENKAINLQVALPYVNKIIIKPGQVFSFCHLIGKPTKKKGYVVGMQLSKGEVKTGIGGGLCQLTNLLYWLALHSPLDVVERHHHSFDPFPDDQRTLPFGTGAGVFYNYIDLRFQNNTDQSFMFELELTPKHLKGRLVSDHPVAYTYHLEERDHRFFNKAGKNFRENRIFRHKIRRISGETINTEEVMHNVSEVKYVPPVTTIF